MEWAFQPPANLARLEETFFAMFREEWRRQRGDASLARIAIVDDDPAGQYLYPEFLLFEHLFARAGVEAVIADAAECLWAERRGLFFKPASGYGSKVAYRGDKLTRRVWEAILVGDCVAQAIAPPSERLTQVGGTTAEFKLDVRVYVYAGDIQLVAARLYAGQTTNFRKPGGGFAPVFVVSDEGGALTTRQA